MNWVILISLLLVAIISYSIGRVNRPLNPPKKSDVLKVIEDVKFSNTIHPLVKDIYLLFIDNPTIIMVDAYYMTVLSVGVKIWAANDVEDRYFKTIPDDLLKKYNMTMKEMNESLTMADKKILETIIQRIRINNKEFISRLFI